MRNFYGHRFIRPFQYEFIFSHKQAMLSAVETQIGGALSATCVYIFASKTFSKKKNFP